MPNKKTDKKNPEQKEKQEQEVNTPEKEETVEKQKEEPVAENEKNPLEEENAQLKYKLLRTLAEYDNFRKRSQKEKEAIYPDAVANTIQNFLPVLDNFERAMAFECTDGEFRKGMDLIQKAFHDALAKLGVEEIPAMGEVFDPNLHSAVMHVEDENFAENTICEVFQKGYKMGDRVIRFAMVKVAN